MPPSEDEASLDDDEFVVPEDPVEQERFQRRLMATARSLKKKQQQLRADQDLLVDRWTEVLAAEEHKLERPSKSYPKRRLLPRLEEEALDAADRPPRGRDREASRPSTQAAPRRRSKNTKAWENVPDLRDILEDKARQSRSIYGSRGRPMIRETTVAPDTVSPAGPNKTDKALSSSIVISPSTEAPHTHCASQMK